MIAIFFFLYKATKSGTLIQPQMNLAIVTIVVCDVYLKNLPRS